jgi:hypothetical protein
MVLQVFLDCVEEFNLMVNSKGVVVHSELRGALQMKAYLSGMPECKLGLNDKTMFARQVWFSLTCNRMNLAAPLAVPRPPMFPAFFSGCNPVCPCNTE